MRIQPDKSVTSLDELRHRIAAQRAQHERRQERLRMLYARGWRDGVFAGLVYGAFIGCLVVAALIQLPMIARSL